MKVRRYVASLFIPVLLILCCLAPSPLTAQSVITIDAQNFVETCDGLFTDSGGTANDHGTTSQQITICSDDSTPGRSHIRLNFSQLEIEGRMIVYNGDQVDPNTILFDYDPATFVILNPPSIQATASNSTGCLTITFEPTNVPPREGWTAAIECVRSCQPVEAVVLDTDPTIMPVDTGYIDACPGALVRFEGSAIFREDGVVYDQDVSTSVFEWNFGNGFRATGQEVEHRFMEGGGYVVQLTVTDIAGCESINQINQRVRISEPANFQYNPPATDILCPGEPVSLTSSLDPNANANLSATTSPQSFQFRQADGDTVYLPDGNGVEHTDTLIFANFINGATLNSVNDIFGICVNMEHSYVGDLNISIECPDGREIDLVDNAASPNLGRQWVGRPLDNNDNPVPGEGLDYCWTPDADLTWNTAIALLNIGEDQSIPAGNYRSNDPFSDLIGCPLNGPWVLHVFDDELFDNGYIFSWGFSFAEELSLQESFQNDLTDGSFVNGTSFDFYSSDSVVLNTDVAGDQAITYEVTDDFGCVSDTTVILTVLPGISPTCYDCGAALLDSTNQSVSACGGGAPTAGLGSRTSVDTIIKWGVSPSASFSFDAYPNAANPYRSSFTVSDMQPGLLTNAPAQIASVCVNMETVNTGEVSLFLEGPNGSRLELSTNNGSGLNFTSTCFRPDATQSITTGSSPFTGDFSPEGSWNVLNGEPVNGRWTLVAWDEGGTNSPGRIIDWSIEFLFENELTYSWSPAAGLSCTDCPNPTITATEATTYTLTVTDLFGCSETGTVDFRPSDLGQVLSIDGNMPSCAGLADGSVSVGSSAGGNYTYAWSNNATGATISGVSAGDYSVSVSQGSCTEVLSFSLTDPDRVTVALSGVDSVSCAGGSDGRVDISAEGGTGELNYQWDDPNQQELEDAVFLSAGNYTVSVTDANGCPATLTATVEEPAAVALSFTTEAVACRDQSTGSATVTPSGGNGTFSYNWETGSRLSVADMLAAGSYAVTVTDRKGCFAVDSVAVTQPTTAITLAADQDERGCAGESLNVATAVAGGGVGPYQYTWSNGSLGATANDLPGGNNTVYVTDDAGCVDSLVVELEDLEPITFNLIATQPSCSGSTDGAMGFNQLTGGAATDDDQYTYQWSTGGTDIVTTNLSGGATYSLTVTDPQGCQGVQSRMLEDPPGISVTADVATVSCFGFSDGSISITDLFGPNVGDFTLQWGPNAGSSTADSVGGLAAGDYTLRITDVKGCIQDEAFSVKEPDRLDATFARDDVTCFGDFDGSISATVQGGVPGYTYLWSNGSTGTELANLPAGDYDLTVTDGNGCELLETVTIIEPNPVIATAESEAVRCFGDATGRIQINATGGRGPFTYSLDNTGFSRSEQFIGLTAGDYIVYVRDVGGCINTTEVTVEDGPEFFVDLGPDSTIIFGDSIRLDPNLSGAVGEVTYAWRGSYDGTLLCRGDNTPREETTVVTCQRPTIRPEYEIDYTLLAIDENGCEAEDRVRISVRKIRVVEVPTGFTPNLDGQNDELMVHGRPGTRVAFFRVFDRWGEVIHEAVDFAVNDRDAGWEGDYKGQNVPAGVYLWQMEVIYEDQSREILSGETTLIR